MEGHILRVIDDKEAKNSFKLSVNFEEKLWSLTIFKDLKAWSTEVYVRAISNLAKLQNQTDEEFTSTVKEYFTKTPENVSFRFNNGAFTVFRMANERIKLKYFYCEMMEVDYGESMYSILEKMYDERNKYCIQLNSTIKEKDELKECNKNLLLQLGEIIERKRTDEEEVYSKFVLVLNEKKRQIQHLNELLEAFKRGRPTVNPPVTVKRRKNKKDGMNEVKEIKKDISDSETEVEEDYNTDDEKNQKEENNQDDVPSTSGIAHNIFPDDSPPSYALPKRIKTRDISSDKPAEPSSTVKNKTCVDNDERSVTETDQNSPNIDFNTQDLLDDI